MNGQHQAGHSKTLFAIAGTLLLMALGGAGNSRAAESNAVATVIKQIALPGRGSVVAGGGSVWATDGRGRLARIDPATNRVVARIPLATRSPQLCCGFGFRALWVADMASNTLIRVGIRERAVLARIPVGNVPVGTAVGFGSVWVANNGSGSVMRIDPTTNKVVANIRVGRSGSGPHYGNGPLALAGAGDAMWATVPNSGTVVRIDPRRNRTTATLPAEGQCTLTARGRSVWAAAACGKTTMSRIDAGAARITATQDVGDVPGPPVVLGRYVWTVTFSGRLVRLDARTLKLSGRMPLRGLDVEGESVAAAHGALWVRAKGVVVRLAPR